MSVATFGERLEKQREKKNYDGFLSTKRLCGDFLFVNKLNNFSMIETSRGGGGGGGGVFF